MMRDIGPGPSGCRDGVRTSVERVITLGRFANCQPGTGCKGGRATEGPGRGTKDRGRQQGGNDCPGSSVTRLLAELGGGCETGAPGPGDGVRDNSTLRPVRGGDGTCAQEKVV